jgi:type VII secretion-associated serine protease mycosin
MATATAAVLAAGMPAYADRVRDQEWHLTFLNVDQAHRYSQGDNVVVGVVDTGVDANHPDLAGNILAGADLVSGSGNGWNDLQGHGTHMAGLIAGHGHGAGDGVLGVAPKARILPVTIGVRTGADRQAAGIEWAVEHGARVICLATGSPADNDSLHRAIREAFARDVVVVAGVGNHPEDTEVRFPARYDGVIAAAGIDQTGEHAAVSVTGPAVVLSAPAVDVVSTAPYGGYSVGVGTSDATAIIAGAAALVRARYPNLSAPEVVHRLTATATDKGLPGRDDQYGYGIVNLVGALTADVPPLPSGAPSTATNPSPSASARAAPGAGHIPPALVIAVLTIVLAAGGVLVVLRRRRHGRTP